MKKISFALCGLLLLLGSCKKSATPSSSEDSDEVQAITKRSCGSYEVLQQQLKADPGLAQRMNQIEDFTRKAIASGSIYRKAGDTIEIPVVVHVLYNKAAQNISDG